MQARNHILTNIIVSQNNTIECNIKSQDSVDLHSIKKYADKIIREMIIHLNQNHQNKKIDVKKTSQTEPPEPRTVVSESLPSNF